MNQFALTQEQTTLLDEADRFARDKLYPLAQQMDNDEWWPDGIMEKLGNQGYLGATVPEKYGGAGMGLLEAGLVIQAFARWNHAFALSWGAHDNLCANNLYVNGSDELRDRYLPKLCSGEYVGALGLTEPGAGSDALGSMRTKAVRDGDFYILNGSKMYITNGPIADIVLVYAKSQPDLGNRGVTAFIVETDTPGFQIAQKLTKMGFRGSPTAELVFEDVVVPVANIVGSEHEGHQVVMSGLDIERAALAPISIGIAERALELSIEYANDRYQFGKPIASFQMIQSMIADMYTWVETMKAFTYQVLAELADVDATSAGRGEIHARTAAVIMYNANTVNQILNHAVQIHGGAGYLWDTEINRLFRATKLGEIGAGTTEVRKLIIAGEVLGR
ncbi:MAG: isovaleryl-CoA dehydrogenase [Acidimicrobiia bacterium]|nr:isovaleryl-CoA dehydrogenase [Acidimicrobiia bacterium]